MAREIKARKRTTVQVWAVVDKDGDAVGAYIYEREANASLPREVEDWPEFAPYRVVALTGELREPARRAKGKEGR